MRRASCAPFRCTAGRHISPRGQAQALSGITSAQRAGLSLGRVPGTNHRTGCRHRHESKARTAAANRAFWAAHPERAIARGVRGERHYRWNGGSSRLNTSIRTMTENRRWMAAVKARDGRCLRCGGGSNLEAHHRIALAVLVAAFGIRSRDDARANATALWDTANGATLCRSCHYAEHGRAAR
jgi:5-methylcytosine-specific restriction endonuclease McrA